MKEDKNVQKSHELQKTVPCFPNPSWKPEQNTLCPCLQINAKLSKDASSHPTYWSSSARYGKPSRGIKKSLWMHHAFAFWLVKTGYEHKCLLQADQKQVQLYQMCSSSAKILSLWCSRSPDSRMPSLTLQKVPCWKRQALVGCQFWPSTLQGKDVR